MAALAALQCLLDLPFLRANLRVANGPPNCRCEALGTVPANIVDDAQLQRGRCSSFVSGFAEEKARNVQSMFTQQSQDPGGRQRR